MSSSAPDRAVLGAAPDAGRGTPLSGPPTTAQLVAGFGAVYLIWGSTYLAIRIAIETIPPFTMAGFRFLIAGGLLYPWVRLRLRGPAPTAAHWRNTTLLGALLFLLGNGAVVWAEETVSSGLVALLVGMLPLWMVLVDWIWGAGRRPGPMLIAGLIWGFLGVGLLASSDGLGGGGARSLLPVLVVIVGGVSWAFASIRMKTMRLPAQPGLATAMEMLCGGALLVLAGAATGELARLHPAAVSTRSLLALLYLVGFGSLIGFSAFKWLMSVAPPARVATYAYVNPVVALLLGWALADEPLTGRTLLAAAIILSAVVLISKRGGEA
jgi:drug/metabolite transporter (DMT)-like permease